MPSQVPISDLCVDERNPRRMSMTQRKRLRDSIQAFGFVDPVVVRRSDKLVIGGHQRLTAARELGLTEVPVVWWEGDDRTARALSLALNQIEGEWDEAKLADVLSELAGVESLSQALLSFDTTLTSLAGFDAKDVLKALASGLDSPAPGEDLAGLASKLLARQPDSTAAQVGDLYQLGPHRLLCGDSLEARALQRLCGDVAPSLLFTDPPYGVSYSADSGSGRHASGRSGGRRAKPLGAIANDELPTAEHGQFISNVLVNAVSVLEAGASVYLCGGTSTTTIYDQAFESAGLAKASIIVWDKIDLTFGRRDYQSQYEFIYYGWAKGRHHRFYGGRAQTDIWTIPRDATSTYVHPTQKPVALAERAIRNSTRAGDVVLDLFGGSGSTLVAAEQSGRKAFLLEVDPHFVDVIIARWQALTGSRAELMDGGQNA